MSQVVEACPLCGATAGEPVQAVPFATIWQTLADERGARFEDDVVARHTPAPQTTLRACTGCDLQYFTPSIAGDADFYEQLTRTTYYEDDRWEFGIVATTLDDGADVLDIGCGRGGFLRQAAGRTGRTVGVDLNREAIEHLRSTGIEAYAEDSAVFADRNPGTFDVVCGFQILEHVPDAATLLAPAAALVRPGGRVLVSVPNRDRYRPAGLEPLDCPPHHISRWSRDQFSALARRFGLELEDVRFEPPDFANAEDWWFTTIASRTARVLGGRAGLLAARAHRRYRVSPARHEAWVRGERFSRRGVYGHTMLVELRRPLDS